MSATIVWFRHDLRLADNPALAAALERGLPLLPLYIHAPDEEAEWAEGSATRWWRHHSLTALDAALRRRGSRLIVRSGPSLQVLRTLLAESGADTLFWNRRYEPAVIARDTVVKDALRRDGYQVRSFNASLLHEPWQITRKGEAPYRVFTAYWKACRRHGLPLTLHDAPAQLPPAPAGASEPLESLGLRPHHTWPAGLQANWQPGEAAALRQLTHYTAAEVGDYMTQRDFPARAGTSRLSPHLHFGEVSPQRVAATLLAAGDSTGLAAGAEAMLRQLYWREFAHHLLYYYPQTTVRPLDVRFTAFPWAQHYAQALRAWQRGETGIPLVDAGMRELWQTGWMHNRVRMVVASFLTKNLLIPWQEGARWFWETLVDADLANNTLGWQWAAGSGADAAPYFRVFNPVLQGEKFDPQGHYVRRWLPELNALPDRLVHKPWEAGGVAGYPAPIIGLKTSRARALAAYQTMRNARKI